MNIGMVGMGKLGLPVALAIDSKGHNVMGYDISPLPSQYLENHEIPYTEANLQPLLDDNRVQIAQTVGEVVAHSDLLFVAIQTPHESEYEGATRIPETRKDFDYSHLVAAIGQIAAESATQEKPTTVAVISTCLPGTFNKDIRPLLNEYVQYVYTPQFIAMGTVLADYLNPEFSLIGVDDEAASTQLQEFYGTLFDKPQLVTDTTTAEAIKVSYNTFITMKTVLANTWGELAHKTGANVDDIYRAWSMSTNRLLSPKYLKAGVGDGGGCHPRDNIALSWLANEVGLSHNLFEDLMQSREDHMSWLAKEASVLASKHQLPLVVLGKSFKPETNIETGSPAVLLSNILTEYGQVHEHAEDFETTGPAVFIIGTQHERYVSYDFPAGSVVLDPFRYIAPRDDITVIAIGS
jgi:UDPglucose 6-dehydrogenase